jgi:hypothetical protein
MQKAAELLKMISRSVCKSEIGWGKVFVEESAECRGHLTEVNVDFERRPRYQRLGQSRV